MKFLIKQISTSRTEIRISINSIDLGGVQYYMFGTIGGAYDEGTISSKYIPNDLTKYSSLGPSPAIIRLIVAYLKDTLGTLSGFSDTVLTIEGIKHQLPIVNVAVDDINLTNLNFNTIPTLVIKLAEELPADVTELSEVFIEKQLITTQEHEIYYIPKQEVPLTFHGLDYDEGMTSEVGTPDLPKIKYQNYNSLTESFQHADSSVVSEILSGSNLNLKIDYTNYENYIFFGSAVTRLENFKNKVKNIENYLVQVSQSLELTSSVVVARFREDAFSNIQDIKNSFSPYEKEVYYRGDRLGHEYNISLGSNYVTNTPLTRETKLLNEGGFTIVHKASGSNTGNIMSLFDSKYFVEDKPFYNNSGSFYLSFLMRGDESINGNLVWNNTQEQYVPRLPKNSLYTSSILNPPVTSSKWNKYIFLASASYWAPSPTNPIIGRPGSITNFSSDSEVQFFSGSGVSGSYAITAGGRYTNLATTITSSGYPFTGSIVPAGELFNIYVDTSYSSAITSSYLTDVKITKFDPGDVLPFSDVHRTGSDIFVNWYDTQYELATAYDEQNVHTLMNSLPEYFANDNQMDNKIFRKFVNLIGEHFDLIKNYVDNYVLLFERTPGGGGADNLLPVLANQQGWEFMLPFGDKKDADLLNFMGSTISSINTTEAVKYNVWRNILNNLNYIYKTKGTQNSLRGLLNSYGFPPDILKLQEHGASLVESTALTDDVSNLSDGLSGTPGGASFTTKFAQMTMWVVDSEYRKIGTDWRRNEVDADAIEFVFKPEKGSVEHSILQSSGSSGEYLWDVILEPSASDSVKSRLSFRLNNTSNGSSDITDTANSISMSTDYQDFKNQNYWNVLLQRTAGPTGSDTYTSHSYEMFVGESRGDKLRVFSKVSMSFGGTDYVNAGANWIGTGSRNTFIGGNLIIGGTMTGSLGEIRTWKYPLSASIFKQHIYDKKSAVGNSLLDSQTNLIYRFKLNENWTVNPLGPELYVGNAFTAWIGTGLELSDHFTQLDNSIPGEVTLTSAGQGYHMSVGSDLSINGEPLYVDYTQTYRIQVTVNVLSISTGGGINVKLGSADGGYRESSEYVIDSTGTHEINAVFIPDFYATSDHCGGAPGHHCLILELATRAYGNDNTAVASWTLSNISVRPYVAKHKDSNPKNVKDYSFVIPDSAFTGSSALYDTDEVERIQFNVRVGGGQEYSDNNILIEPGRRFIDNLNPFGPSILNLQDPLINERKASSIVEIVRSPQDVINDFILNQFGNFDFNDLFADPRDITAPAYKDLETLALQFFNYYDISIDVNRYITAQANLFSKEMIKSLKRLVPARASFGKVGVELKPTFLDRTKLPSVRIEAKGTGGGYGTSDGRLYDISGGEILGVGDTKLTDWDKDTYSGRKIANLEPLPFPPPGHLGVASFSGSVINLVEELVPNKLIHFAVASSTGSLINLTNEFVHEKLIHFAVASNTGSVINLVEELVPNKLIHFAIASNTGSLVNLTEEFISTKDIHFAIASSTGSVINLIEEYVPNRDIHFAIASNTGSVINLIEEHVPNRDIHFVVASNTGSLVNLTEEFISTKDIHFAIASNTGSLINLVEEFVPSRDVYFAIASHTGSLINLTNELVPRKNIHFTIASNTGSIINLTNELVPEKNIHFSISSHTGSLLNYDYELSNSYLSYFSISSHTGSLLNYDYELSNPYFGTISIASNTGSLVSILNEYVPSKLANISVSSNTGSIVSITNKLLIPLLSTMIIASNSGSVINFDYKIEEKYNLSYHVGFGSKNNSILGDAFLDLYNMYDAPGHIELSSATGSKPIITEEVHIPPVFNLFVASATGSNPTISQYIIKPYVGVFNYIGNITFIDKLGADYPDLSTKWGKSVNDLHFIQPDWPGKAGEHNTYHYEKRYIFTTIGDVENVSGSVGPTSASFETDFTGTVFNGAHTGSQDIKNKVFVKNEIGLGTRPLGVTVEFRGIGEIVNGGKFLDENFIYPPNHSFLIGTTKDQLTTLIYEGTQNGPGPKLTSNTFIDISEDAVYEIWQTGAEGYYTTGNY